MGIFQDETFANALKLALAARLLSPSMPYTFPGQVPIVFPAPPTFYDLMNPTTTKPFTILDPYLSPYASIKTLRPSYVAVPLYTIVPLHILQVQAPPPYSAPSPHLPDPAFWNVLERTVEHSVHGAVALAWLLSETAKTTPQKDPVPLRDAQDLPSCDSFDLSSLPPIPTEDDLLRVDMAELELIPSSELYSEEAEPATAKPATPKPFSSKSQSPPSLRSSSSDATLGSLLEDYLPGEDLSVLLQIPDNELYFDLEHLDELGATPPWRFNSSAFPISSTPSLT